MHIITVRAPRTFFIKRLLQLSIAHNKTKVNVVKFPGNLFFLSNQHKL